MNQTRPWACLPHRPNLYRDSLQMSNKIKTNAFIVMPSGQRYEAPSRKTDRYAKSFPPSAISLLNTAVTRAAPHHAFCFLLILLWMYDMFMCSSVDGSGYEWIALFGINKVVWIELNWDAQYGSNGETFTACKIRPVTSSHRYPLNMYNNASDVLWCDAAPCW